MNEQWPRCGHREELFLTAFFDLAQAGMCFDSSYWVEAMVEKKTGVERRKLKQRILSRSYVKGSRSSDVDRYLWH